MAITKPPRQSSGSSAAPGFGVPPVGITGSAPRRARRPVVVAVGTILTVVGALGAYALVNHAGDRVAVLAVATAVPRGQVVTAADLTVAQVAPDPALRPVPEADSGQIVGKTAAVDLPVGSLLTSGSVRAGTSLTAGKTLVGVLAKPGVIPAGQLLPGDNVTVVNTPGPNGAGSAGTKTTVAPLTINAVVVSVGAADANGNSIVDLAADPGDGPQLATWASTGSVAITKQAGS
ncbi:SAF domain-containing protein [Streptacidiphilus sp. EB129]|uniref:SAF domain-containing protein n=1 Tax=Streptacidiphilus sp. EB129 TaxID=3156262 RepID=UPI003512BAD4